MSFGSNLQFVRKMHNTMTQEELAEKLGVSRQTISKWEMNIAFPEMEKSLAICQLFNCSLDELFRKDMNSTSEAYADIQLVNVEEFYYVTYSVISVSPEEDALAHLKNWASDHEIDQPTMIGWDFPYVSQEQTNVYRMHGYCAACIMPEQKATECKEAIKQVAAKYVKITIKDPFSDPFVLIPNAYTTLMRYIDVNGLKHRQTKDVIECFEKSYTKNGIAYMDVSLAIY